MEWIRRRDPDGRIELLAYQDPASRARFGTLPDEAFEGALQLLLPDGARVEGARAVEEVLRRLPAGRAPRLLFALPGARPLAGAVYRWMARNRRRFGCGVHCSRPPARPRDAGPSPGSEPA